MTTNDAVRARMRALAAELGPDDGLSDLELRRRERRPRGDRKTLQLCARVRRILTESLAAAADPALRAVEVVAVQPAPDARRLRVHVRGGEGAPEEGVARVRAALPWLRSEVAHGLVRRRTPHLMVLWEGP